jgi:serine protease Do
MSISRLTPRSWRGALLAGLLGTTALGGYAAGHVGLADSTTQLAPIQAAAIQPTAPAQPLADFSALATQAKPAVVSITNELSPQAAADEEEGGAPSPFGATRPQHAHPVEARGSGFIIDADGTIVTNNHVVKGARSVSVTLDDGTQLPAKVIGTDPRTDIAVLKVEAGRKLPYIELGDSDRVKVGEWVVAMGNPFGLGGSVTAGIVSARSRDIGSGPYDNFLQVDAPINRGNSGGPLFTQDGRVVGVNTAILSPTGGSVGIGFAIPSNMVKSVVAQLEQSGHVTRGYLGVQAQPINPGLATALHLGASKPGGYGALVASVEPDSPAAKADVKPGDIIVAVNGKPVTNPRDLATDVAAVMPGEQAKIEILRDGAAETLTASVAALPGDTADNATGEQHAAQGHIGLALAPLNPETRSQLDLPARTKGAVVAEVQPGSPAEAAGIQQGDVIVGVGMQAVGSPEQATHAIRDALHGGKAVALRILRDGHTAFVAVDPNKGDNAG